MAKIFVLNGPNLDMLGIREPEIYGHETLADIAALCAQTAARLGLAVDFRQTNGEATMVEWLHEAYRENAAVICNPAGLSFFSVPVLDAVKILRTPYLEVHISNIHGRDEFHRHSMTATAAKGVICGFGSYGYVMALEALAHQAG